MGRKYALFDMDGVLLDSEAGSFAYMQKALLERGISISMKELLSKVGRNSRRIAEELIEEHRIPETPEEFLQKNRESGSYYADSPQLLPMEGLEMFLNALRRRGIRIAVVSSTRAESVLTALNRLRLIPWTEVIVCGDMVKRPKPNPDGYLLAAGWLGARPEECVVFEDSPIGVQAARNAGMKVIGYKGSVLSQDTSAADLEYWSYEACRADLDAILR